MKLNQRIYDYADDENLLDSQELDGHNVQIYNLNAYEDMLTEFTAKGKFAVWSSVDGTNYRLFVEEGYYNKLKPLYESKINAIWLNFWDSCEKVTTKFRNIVMPLALVVILIVFGSTFLLNNSKASLIVTIATAALYFLGVMLYKRVVNKKLGLLNAEAVAEIKKHMGEKRFERLLDDQRSYMDEYFKYDEEDNTEVVEEVNEEVASEEKTEVVEVENDNAVDSNEEEAVDNSTEEVSQDETKDEQ